MDRKFAEPQQHAGVKLPAAWHPAPNPSIRRRIRAVLAGVQAKSAVTTSADPCEKEADRIAEALSLPCLCPGNCLDARTQKVTPAILRHAGSAGPEGGLNVPDCFLDRLGEGQPLSPALRSWAESGFGRDFGRVRVHTGPLAVASARAINALAFTAGSDIIFDNGQFAPHSGAGRKLLAHELAHVVQQSDSAGSPCGANGPIIQRVPASATALDEQEFGRLPESQIVPVRPARITTPSSAAPAPPPSSAPPPAGSFSPLTGAALTDRVTHGMSRDPGPMISEIESEVFPTGGTRPSCTPRPANFNDTLADELSTSLQSDVPDLAPVSAPDPMGIASETAQEAMPIIASHYAPHAPVRSPAAFMAIVSRKPVNFGDPIRNNIADFAEFIEWYSGERDNLRNLTADKCGMTRAWWNVFAAWLAGSSRNSGPARVRERAALFDTYHTTVTEARSSVQFGLAFDLWQIPHTVTHEAMHLFQHAGLDAQLNLLQDIRSSKDIFTEGMAEYLARGVRDQVVTAIQGHTPPPLSASDANLARAGGGYPFYFDRVVAIRDILYRHGQDGEESIRRAFFLGEGWRFALLETASGAGSPIETDRPLPGPVDVHFDTASATPTDAASLNATIAYLTTRSVARVEVVGRTDTTGTDAANVSLGLQRANSVRAVLRAAGIQAGRISVSSRGTLDQIPGDLAANRRATVTVIDPRNESPGLPGPGRP